MSNELSDSKTWLFLSLGRAPARPIKNQQRARSIGHQINSRKQSQFGSTFERFRSSSSRRPILAAGPQWRGRVCLAAMGALCVLKRRLAELTCCRQRQTNGDRSRFATTKSFMAGWLASATKVGLNLVGGFRADWTRQGRPRSQPRNPALPIHHQEPVSKVGAATGKQASQLVLSIGLIGYIIK